MKAFVFGNKHLAFESLKLGKTKQQWSGQSDPAFAAFQCQEFKFDEESLKTLPVNPNIFETRKTQSVVANWVSVYLLALYKGDAIKGYGSLTSIWFSINNEIVFAIRSTYARKKSSTWLEHLQDR